MVRVTKDIWDEQKGIDQCFAAWRKWQGKEEPGFWIDMDMIPFGQLQLMSPKPENIPEDLTKEDLRQKQKKGELTNIELLAGKGWTRWSKFTKDQMYTFITLRALSGSPLMMGGDLPTLDDFSLELITNKDMLDCNQNGVMGHLVYEKDGVEVWQTPKKKSTNGWIGVFNRTKKEEHITLSQELLGFDSRSHKLHDIWTKEALSLNDIKDVPSNGVIFIKYSEN